MMHGQTNIKFPNKICSNNHKWLQCKFVSKFFALPLEESLAGPVVRFVGDSRNRMRHLEDH